MISSPSRALGALLLGLTILAQPVTVTARTTPVQHYPLHLHVDRNTVSFSSSRSAFSTPRLSSPCDSVTLSPCHLVAPSDDPTDLLLSSFLGGRDYDQAATVAVSADGEGVIAGWTNSPDFPVTSGAFSTHCCGAFISKFSPDGRSLIFSTFLDGPDGGAKITGIALGPDGSVYATGNTSGRFPTTPGAFNRTCCGQFVSHLSADGSRLLYSTFLGGNRTGNEFTTAEAIALGPGGDAYVAGYTSDGDYPTTPGAYQTGIRGGTCGDWGAYHPCYDRFVTRLNPDGSGQVYSTFVGGGDDDYLAGLAVAPDGTAVFGGYTYSGDYPITPGAFDPTYAGGDESAVSRLNAAGSDLIFSTYLRADVEGVAAGVDGSAYATGYGGLDFPTTPGAYRRTCCGAFVSHIQSDGSGLVFSTYLPGGTAYGIGLGPDGSATVGGISGDGMVTTPGAYDRSYNGNSNVCYGTCGDGFISRIDATGSTLLYATYLGGRDNDCDVYYCDLAVGPDGTAYLTGKTQSANFPTTPGAFQTTYHGGSDCCGGDGFLSRFQMLDDYATVQGTISDATTGEPLAGATVTATEEISGTLTATQTDASGYYTLTLSPGSYTFTVSQSLYQTQTTPHISIPSGPPAHRVVQNFALLPAAQYQIQGRVGDVVGRRPISTTILISGQPSIHTNADGRYSLRLPSGTYSMTALAPSCLGSVSQVVTVPPDQRVDFRLRPVRDAGGYSCEDVQPRAWISPTTLLPLTGDDRAITVTLPFPFRFYGATYSQASVSTNGLLNFGAPDTRYQNTCLPSTAAPPALIAAFWDDLDVDDIAAIRQSTTGIAPNRVWTVAWINLRPAALDGTRLTFQVQLAESSGDIWVVYRNLQGPSAAGQSATAGIQDATQAIATQYSCFQPSLHSGLVIHYQGQ